MSKCTTMAMTTLRWCLFVECIGRVSCWGLALNKQRVCLYCCVCTWNCFLGMFQLNGVNYWWLMQYEVVITPLFTPQWRWCLLHHNVIMAMMALRWCLFVWCMEWYCIAPGWTACTLHCCMFVLALGCFISDWCSMRSQFHPRALFCCPMAMAALLWCSFAECMERTSCSP